MPQHTLGYAIGVSTDPRKPTPTDELCMPDLYVGLELELEDISRIPESMHWWEVILDGSLRGAGAREFVLKVPLGGEELLAALDELHEVLNHPNQTINPTFRCSTHVHLDVRALTTEQLNSLAACYCIVEPILFQYAAHGRENNLYCIPMTRSSSQRETLARLLQVSRNVGDYISVLETQACKYAAMNLVTASSIGSAEFRHMPPITNKAGFIEWIDILMHVYKWAVHSGVNATHFPMVMSNEGPTGFLHTVFGKHAPKLLSCCADINIPHTLYASARAAQDINNPRAYTKCLEVLRAEYSTGGKNKLSSRFHEVIKKISKDYDNEEIAGNIAEHLQQRNSRRIASGRNAFSLG